MSNAVRYDPPLVRALAAELHATLAGRSCHPLPVFDADLSAVLPLDRGEALRFDLHPSRGWIRVLSAKVRESERAKVRVDPAEASARIVRVVAPADERLLRVDLREGGRFRGGARSLVIELHTNQWNALLVDTADRRIVSLLRTRDAGGRSLRSGEVYVPPEPQRRISADGRSRDELRSEWMNRFGSIAPSDRRVELLRSFAGASPINAVSVLGSAVSTDDPAALETAFERWWEMATRDAAEPVLLDATWGKQPYPFALDGFESIRIESILDGMETLASAAPAEGSAEAKAADLLPRARKRMEGARKRIESLRKEMARVGEADALRAKADLLLANLGRVQAGAAKVTVFDHDGRKVKIAIDPALRPHENAERWYEEARRRARAEERLPELIERAVAEAARWEEAVASVEAGDVPPWVEGALAKREAKEAAQGKREQAERKPYRVYRTSGGLEVRVGRTSKDNDQLTFRHASPDDVWLHARQVPGSHVILRWREEGAPPARDLEEAAVLAALYSKARSSGTVAVSWTRRKYVRKPRGAPPGRVTVQHAKTVFVAPDASVEERLREP